MRPHTKICDDCGNLCDINDTYCKKCSRSFSKTTVNREPIMTGIEEDELKSFIGKNAGYYLNQFAKAKDKKIFVQCNFAALLFGPGWFFYRKMSKVAIVYVAVVTVISAVLSVCIPMAFRSDIDAYCSAREAYADYVNSDQETYIFGDNAYDMTIHPTYERLKNDLKACQHKIRLISILIDVPVLVLHIVFRLFANSFYKEYILSHIHTSVGGTSGKSAFWGVVLVGAAVFVVSLLLWQIPVVSRFQNATQTLLNWL